MSTGLDQLKQFFLRLKSPSSDILSSISINFLEKYYYDITVANIPENQPSDTSPAGELIIKIPYKQWREIDKREKASRFKSKLKVQNYDRTDLDSIFHLDSNHGQIPIDKIICQAKEDWSQEHELTAYNLTRAIELPYTPSTLQILPASLPLSIRDEKEIIDSQEIRELQNEQSKNNKIALQIAKQTYAQSGFSNSLLFALRVVAKLPTGLLKDDDVLWVEKVSLKWPTAISPHQVTLFILKPIERDESMGNQFIYYEKPVFYEAENGFITWTDLPMIFTLPPKEDEYAHVEYSTWWMQLQIKEPGEFYSQKEIEGSIKIKIPTLLSGLSVPEGFEFQKVLSLSEININLRIHIEEIFLNKSYYPYQYLHFPNLILNEMRLADILHILSDMRFELWHSPLDAGENVEDKNYGGKARDFDSAFQKYLIIAERVEGSGIMRLWIHIEGFTSRTTREKEIVGNEKFITGFPAGNTAIYIRGQLEGDSIRAVKVITEIQKRLKERFHHVSILQ